MSGDSNNSDLSKCDVATPRSSCKKVAAVIYKFDAIKKKLVRETCFGGLLHLPQINKLDRKFTVLLLCNVDPDKRSIKINDNVSLNIIDEDVHRIMQIPMGAKTPAGLECQSFDEKIEFIRIAMGSVTYDPEELNSLKVAEKIITKDYKDGMDQIQIDQFKTSFVCFIMGYFLIGRSSANHGSKDYWGSLLKPEEISSYNFCEAAINEIMNAARKVQYDIKMKKRINYISCCPLLLQVH